MHWIIISFFNISNKRPCVKTSLRLKLLFLGFWYISQKFTFCRDYCHSFFVVFVVRFMLDKSYISSNVTFITMMIYPGNICFHVFRTIVISFYI